jgi:rhomboid family protein
VNGYGPGGGVRMGAPLTDGVKILLIWNGIMFLLQHFVLAKFQIHIDGIGHLHMSQFLGIVPVLVIKHGYIWQVVSYMFLHGGFTHILFNMFALWMFGSDLERLWGTRRFLIYFFFTGVGAGILNVLVTPNSTIAIVGASGAIYGLLLAFAYYFPERKIYVYFLFPVPVRIFVVVFGGIELIMSITSSSGGGVAHLVHLGGLIFGWIFIKWLGPLIGDWERQRKRKNPGVIDFSNDQDYWRR